MSRPAHVWLVTDVYPPDCGGSGWSAHALAGTLTHEGHDVEVIALDPSTSVLSQRTFEGIRISEVGVQRAKRSPRRRLGARDYSYTTLASYLSARLAREPHVDVVHAQHLHSGPPALETARSHGRGALLTLRDYWPVCLHGTSWWGGKVCMGCSSERMTGCMKEYWGWPGLLARTMVPWARRRLAARQRGVSAAHRVLAVSEAVSGRIRPELGAVDLQVLHNIVDPEGASAAAARAEGALRALDPPPAFLLTAGKLLATKGFDRLLDVLAKTGSPWPLLVAGSGPERNRLQHQADATGLDIRFLEWTDHDLLLALTQQARAFILPSAWNEPLSRLLLETMGLGTPVIAWAAGGSVEVIEDGQNGWLVAEPADLSRALEALSSDQERERVGANAREYARRTFSPAAVYPQVIAAYEAAMEAAGRETRKDADNG
jgi:glycogen(starch) synthase